METILTSTARSVTLLTVAAALVLAGCCTTKTVQTAWEYKVVEEDGVSRDYSGDLRRMAVDGWEVVSSQIITRGERDDLSVVLRRPKR